jgi:protein SCO1/2
MSKLQTALKSARQTSVRLLSVSVDPEWDTPERLSIYADKHGADPKRWFFLTGELNAVQQLVKEGFQLAMMNEMNEMNERNAPPQGSHPAHGQHKQLEQIVHSDRFVLIDPEFRIRAYYRGNEAGLIDQVLHDIDILQREYEHVL